MKSDTSEIILCYKCKGRGKTMERENAYESVSRICRICEGTGRLLEVVTVEYTSFGGSE